jgi:hypothetical protein
MLLGVGLKTERKLSVHFERKMKWRAKNRNISGILRKRNGNGITLNRNGKGHGGAFSDGNENGNEIPDKQIRKI